MDLQETGSKITSSWFDDEKKRGHATLAIFVLFFGGLHVVEYFVDKSEKKDLRADISALHAQLESYQSKDRQDMIAATKDLTTEVKELAVKIDNLRYNGTQSTIVR